MLSRAREHVRVWLHRGKQRVKTNGSNVCDIISVCVKFDCVRNVCYTTSCTNGISTESSDTRLMLVNEEQRQTHNNSLLLLNWTFEKRLHLIKSTVSISNEWLWHRNERFGSHHINRWKTYQTHLGEVERRWNGREVLNGWGFRVFVYFIAVFCFSVSLPFTISGWTWIRWKWWWLLSNISRVTW